ncbi:excitatory amino acid transporter 3-like [Labrus bergylta]|uniref:excitatory amino acid transporter 3-like n=1 Tax=Labrus bergylta TaxID=56723 RepID=UPI0033143E41
MLVVFIKPGVSGEVEFDDDDESFSSALALMDLIRNMVPNDLILATFQQYKTRIMEFELDEDELNSTQIHTEVRLVGEYIEGVNILGLIIAAAVIGICLRRMGERSKPMVDVVIALNKLTNILVQNIIGYFPVGLLFMTAMYVDEVGVNWKTLSQLGKFTAVAFSGLAIHGIIVLPLIYLLFVRRNPLSFIKGICPALLKAMHFSRSAATQLSILGCEEANHIDKRITRFILPLGYNVNQDGTALYEVISVGFIAQICRIYLNWSQILTLAVTVAVSSLGEAGLPTTESVTTIFVLKVLGIPANDACLLLIIQWALDCLSSPVNVLSDCVGAALVAHLSKKELEEIDEREKEVSRERKRGEEK